MRIIYVFLCLFLLSCTKSPNFNSTFHDLNFSELATSWDEAIPLGNGTVGALVWQKDSSLRMSLDRVDLWDLRPMENMFNENFSFKWVQEQVEKGDYFPVQKEFDHPYDRNPGPTKIPGAALQFDISSFGSVANVHLYLQEATSTVTWENGTSLQTFVQATEPVGWFRFENVSENFIPVLIPPEYGNEGTTAQNEVVDGANLLRLGYQVGKVTTSENGIVYHQKGWGDFYYEVSVHWQRKGKVLEGNWVITTSANQENATNLSMEFLKIGFDAHWEMHKKWWKEYWNKSVVSIPDSLLEKQYYNELYKFGSVAREEGYPISLQAVWTADNGKLPPWKGDYHHDLNTQLSYWPAYSANHLPEAMGYLNTLWSQRDTNKKYTKAYFNNDGLNVPGVTTLSGEPMGGWIQYSLSPTVSAWLSQHFYLQWKYSADDQFLKERAYPYLKEVAQHLEMVTEISDDGVRKLPISSSPEMHNNSLEAWYLNTTNHDLALIRFVFSATAEMSEYLGEQELANKYKQLESEMDEFALDDAGGLAIAPGHPYNESHRHFAHAMSIHPLGLIDWNNGNSDQEVIRQTLHRLDELGPDYWTGYSYSWLANLKARAHDGQGAAQALTDFASSFCLKNTFHANGDQSNSGKSTMTYRPFTLEGNFAFASGIQEMLLQSHSGFIEVFPAIPSSWSDASFQSLRAQGAFLVSSKLRESSIESISIISEKGRELSIKLPKNLKHLLLNGKTIEINSTDPIFHIITQPGDVLKFIQ